VKACTYSRFPDEKKVTQGSVVTQSTLAPTMESYVGKEAENKKVSIG
jgi:hypothetical protein